MRKDDGVQAAANLSVGKIVDGRRKRGSTICLADHRAALELANVAARDDLPELACQGVVSSLQSNDVPAPVGFGEGGQLSYLGEVGLDWPLDKDVLASLDSR